MPQFRPRPTARAQELRNHATDADRKLWLRISRRQLEGHKFSRQMPVGPFICDFMCRERMLVIELDGGQHAENLRDKSRTHFIEGEGYRVLRFWNNEVMENIEGVLATIVAALKSSPPPAPSRKREGERHAPLTPSRLREGKSRAAAKGWGISGHQTP